jgi:hypothetical protein
MVSIEGMGKALYHRKNCKYTVSVHANLEAFLEATVTTSTANA